MGPTLKKGGTLLIRGPTVYHGEVRGPGQRVHRGETWNGEGKGPTPYEKRGVQRGGNGTNAAKAKKGRGWISRGRRGIGRDHLAGEG